MHDAHSSQASHDLSATAARCVWNGRIYGDAPGGGSPLTGDAVFLSDLADDPGESNNLRHAHPNVAHELQTVAEQCPAQVKQW